MRARPRPVTPPNQRWKCVDCGAQFRETTDAAKMARHPVLRGGYAHSAFMATPR